jgi:hypothetical protein
MFYAFTVIVVLILVVAAWKLLTGMVKTVALAAILIFACIMVYGMIHT